MESVEWHSSSASAGMLAWCRSSQGAMRKAHLSSRLSAKTGRSAHAVRACACQADAATLARCFSGSSGHAQVCRRSLSCSSSTASSASRA